MNKRLKDVLIGKERNYILPFLWQHGEEEQVIREEIARVYEAGIRSVCVEARPHPDFLGPKWWQDMDIIMEEARSRGMEVWVLDDDHFPTGHAAGRVKEAPEELQRVFLCDRYIDTLGPAQGTSILLDTLLKFGTNKLVSVTAVSRDSVNGELTGEAYDLTDRVHDGVLYWDIPEGYWRVFVVAESRDGGSEQQKDYLNPLNSNSVRILLDTVYEAFYARYKADFGQTLVGFFSDEPGFYNDKVTFDFQSSLGKQGVVLPWSSELQALLESEWGLDFRKQLYLLWHDCGEQSDKVRYTYMNFVSKLYAQNFCGQIGVWCRSHGVEYIGHVVEDNNVHARLGSGAGHFFRSLWGQDMSGLDVVLWQIVPGFDEMPFKWAGGETDSEFFHYGLGKLGASLGHIDPKKQGRAMCEVYGAYGWAEGLKLMKWLTDHMLVRGINYFVPHAFTQKAFPDPDCPPHMYASGKNPQYRNYKHLNQYMNRVSHLLSGGRHIATAAVVYHAEAEWSGPAMLFQKPVKVLMQHQIDCDVVPIDVLLDSASVSDNKLAIHQEDYQILIVPYAEALPSSIIKQLLVFADQGLPIVFIEDLPIRSSEGKDVKLELNRLARHQSVMQVALEELANDLISKGYYDIQIRNHERYLRHYHYVHDDLDVFMFFNEHPNQTIRATVDLPINGEVCAYDAFLNSLIKLNGKTNAGMTEIELVLQPYESIILLCGLDVVSKESLPLEVNGYELTLTGPWSVSIVESENYPQFRKWGDIQSLTNMSVPNLLPRFSGTFRYEAEFDWDGKVDYIELDLGEAYETAEVWVNGEETGVRICPPYKFRVKSLLKGRNKIAIEVTNTLAKDRRDTYSAYVQQEPSGLIGPVRLISIDQ